MSLPTTTWQPQAQPASRGAAPPQPEVPPPAIAHDSHAGAPGQHGGLAATEQCPVCKLYKAAKALEGAVNARHHDLFSNIPPGVNHVCSGCWSWLLRHFQRKDPTHKGCTGDISSKQCRQRMQQWLDAGFGFVRLTTPPAGAVAASAPGGGGGSDSNNERAESRTAQRDSTDAFPGDPAEGATHDDPVEGATHYGPVENATYPGSARPPPVVTVNNTSQAPMRHSDAGPTAGSAGRASTPSWGVEAADARAARRLSEAGREALVSHLHAMARNAPHPGQCRAFLLALAERTFCGQPTAEWDMWDVPVAGALADDDDDASALSLSRLFDLNSALSGTNSLWGGLTRDTESSSGDTHMYGGVRQHQRDLSLDPDHAAVLRATQTVPAVYHRVEPRPRLPFNMRGGYPPARAALTHVSRPTALADPGFAGAGLDADVDMRGSQSREHEATSSTRVGNFGMAALQAFRRYLPL